MKETPSPLPDDAGEALAATPSALSPHASGTAGWRQRVSQDLWCSFRGMWWPVNSPKVTRAKLEAELVHFKKSNKYEGLQALKINMSMLHEDVLIILRCLAWMTRGAIVEFGPYVGGSTIALAQGIRRKRPFVSVEIGGAHSHPIISSDDIFADLQRNVRDYGVTGKVVLINADARAPATKDAIRRTIGSKKIGLLVIDTDGLIDRDLAIYAPLCARGCILVLDDYVAADTTSGLAHTYPGYSPQKSDIVRETVDRMVAAGEVIPFGVYGWGTWIGRTC